MIAHATMGSDQDVKQEAGWLMGKPHDSWDIPELTNDVWRLGLHIPFQIETKCLF
jgi:hypothetical protein